MGSSKKPLLLADIADIQTGPFGSQLHNEDYSESGTPIVTVERLGVRRFTKQNLPLVKDEDRARLSKYSMKAGDVIYSRVGSVDRCSLALVENEGWLFSGRCLRIRPCDKIDPLFLYAYLSSPSVKKFVRNIAVGATMPSINTKLMGEIPIPDIEFDVQRRIGRILNAFDEKVEANSRINDYLAA